jgi:Zn-dependent protease with chaperone function
MDQPREMAYLVFATSILLLPLAATISRSFILSGGEENRSKLWIQHCHANHVLCVLVVSLWCGIWEFPISTPTFVLWLVPSVTMAAVRATRLAISKRVLETRWTASDSLRIVFWSTISPTVSLLMTAAGIHEMLARNLWGIFWFPAAGITALIGTVRLRSAQGLKLHRVKSGTLFSRVMHLSKRVGIKIERVYVVPSGRGDLTNAFASWRGVALTHNFGEYLRGTELDSVIAHELGHVQGHHTRKRILVLACVVTLISFLSLGVTFATPSYRAMFMTFSLIAILLVNSYTSRRCEYACDQKATEFTQNPQSTIRALVALYKKTNSSVTCSRFIELFESHPSLVHRVQAIAEVSGLPPDKVSEFLLRI